VFYFGGPQSPEQVLDLCISSLKRKSGNEAMLSENFEIIRIDKTVNTRGPYASY